MKQSSSNEHAMRSPTDSREKTNIYVFLIGFPYVPKMGLLVALRVKMWKYCVLSP